MRSKQHQYDKILLYTIFALVIFGIIMLSSASVAISQENFGEPYYYLKHQFGRGVLVGLALFYAGFKINYKFWKKISVPLLIINIILLFLVFSDKFGYGYGGAKRWINFSGMVFQPVEILKLSFIFYLAALLEMKKKKGIRDFYEGFLPFSITLIVIAVLIIAQPDISTLGIIVATSIVVYFMAGASFRHLLILSSSGIAALLFLIKVAPYRMNRLLVFLNPDLDPQGIGYQIKQALIAIGSGGIWGLGFGQSRQKLLYLPEAIGDSIFAIIAEELGFIGAVFLVCMFTLLAFRGFKIARNAPNKFAGLTAIGITFWIVLQAFINIAAISGLIPLTGIPLPFISYGGTSLAFTLLGMGIVLNISKRTT